MGEVYQLFRPSFNRAIQVEARDDRLTSDAGMLVVRELEERLGLVSRLANDLNDPRNPDYVKHTMTSLLRARLLMLSSGWRDVNDIDLLRQDPVFRLAISDRRGQGPIRENSLPSVSTMTRLTATLARHPGGL